MTLVMVSLTIETPPMELAGKWEGYLFSASCFISVFQTTA